MSKLFGPYHTQVHDLAEASKSITTLQAMLDRDIQAGCVRNAGSHTRNLLRVKRGIDMVRILFEQMLVTEYVLIDSIATLIYNSSLLYSFRCNFCVWLKVIENGW